MTISDAKPMQSFFQLYSTFKKHSLKLNNESSKLLECYQHATIFHPTTAAKSNVDALKLVVQQLGESFPILKSLGLLANMRSESVTYLTYAQQHAITWAANEDKTKQREAEDEEVLKWWRMWGGFFKSWALAARVIFSIAPSSAAVERMFSIFKRLFQDKATALADIQEAAMLVRNKFDKEAE